MLRFVVYARSNFPTMMKWNFINAITTTNSWVEPIMSVTSIKKHEKYTPVVAHNLSNNDLHFVIKVLAKNYSENTSSMIPASEKKNRCPRQS